MCSLGMNEKLIVVDVFDMCSMLVVRVFVMRNLFVVVFHMYCKFAGMRMY